MKPSWRRGLEVECLNSSKKLLAGAYAFERNFKKSLIVIWGTAQTISTAGRTNSNESPGCGCAAYFEWRNKQCQK